MSTNKCQGTCSQCDDQCSVPYTCQTGTATIASYSAFTISRGHFCPHDSRKIPKTGQLGRGMGVFVSSNCDRSFTFEDVVLFAMSCNIVPRYIESVLYFHLLSNRLCARICENWNVMFYKKTILLHKASFTVWKLESWMIDIKFADKNNFFNNYGCVNNL